MKFRRITARRVVTNVIFIFILLILILAIILTLRNREPPTRTNEWSVDITPHSGTGTKNVEQEAGTRKSCESIHLAFVCGGFNSTRNFYVLLKSILFYRTDLITLHIFVNAISRTILSELFESWVVPDLQVSFYNISDYEQEISWIRSQHYSHRFGLMKLVFLSVLSDQLQSSRQIIVLDSDMLVLGNINRVWRFFAQFQHANESTRPIFAMVENQSDWYLSNTKLSGNRPVWPALGKGFNSGLILVNLDELKRRNWPQLWRQVAESELTSYLSTALADQDIFNAAIRLNPDIIHTLPCWLNIQLNDHTKLDELCYERSDIKIVHWNSPYKLSTKNSKGEYFRNWYLTFRNWDGSLLQRPACGGTYISGQDLSSYSNETDFEAVCREIRPRPREKLRIYRYFVEFELEQIEYDVTLVVHLSLDRIQVFDELASHWPGPISAAIYMSELETNLLLASIENSNNLSNRKNVGYHLVFRDHGFNYPINRLRNVALNNALTPYVFLTDIDFLPSTNLWSYLRQTISELAIREGSDPLTRRALVVPAFENLQYKFTFPQSKADLLTQLNLGSVSMFREQIWPRGHAPTNYIKWRAATLPYRVQWRPEYEPFIVTNRNVTRFDERFVGFGWNKVENVMQLAAEGYEFIVLPQAFVIHKFHSASFDIMKHRESFRYRSCIKHLKRTFLSELRQKYPEFFKSISATNQPIES